MSRFFSERFRGLIPYVPGEQPKSGQKFIKLNTNESPFPPSPRAVAAAAAAASTLRLYSDPAMTALKEKLAETLGVNADEVFVSNGSDEALNFAFAAFVTPARPALFPDITYGFYPVFALVNRLSFREIPLREDFTIDPEDYIGVPGTVCIANPNAPTGLLLPVSDIKRIVASDPDRIVVVDEAYIDFGGQSCVPLIGSFRNLLVTGTFSKSRSMAGARLGWAVGDRALIADLETIKYSTNPYNVNSMTAAAGVAALEDEEYTRKNCAAIIENRAYTKKKLEELGFFCTDSSANFLFTKSDRIGGKALYEALKARGILVRHFDKPRIKDWLRVTVGAKEDMDELLRQIAAVTEEL